MKYVKKRVAVEAVQTPKTRPTAKEYFAWGNKAPDWIHNSDIWMTEDGLIIPTLEGDMLCKWGNWIICGVDGEIYPIRKDIFEQTYEPLEEE